MDKAADKCTGIPGLDDVLTEGMPLNRVTLVQGPPGSGKTTFALQFLVEGARHGEAGLYVTLTGGAAEVDAFAVSHGIDLKGITVLELTPSEFLADEPQSFFHPGEVEMAEISKRIISEAERLRPSRLVIDSLTEVRMSMPDDLLFHRQITAIKHAVNRLGITTVMLAPGGRGPVLQTIAQGVIELDVVHVSGKERRRLRVVKLRDFEYVSGYHDYDLTRAGLCVYPRSVKTEDGQPHELAAISCGISEFDALLGGGIQRGTTTILTGPAGAGKSSIAAQYAMAAAARGERSHVYLFDERIETAMGRAEGLGMPVREAVRDGLVRLEELDPTELSPGEFASKVRAGVHAGSARIVVIDSLSGYLNAVHDEKALMLQMHGLCSYLNRRDVGTFLTLAQAGVFGAATQSSLTVDLSYLADAVILFRSFEAGGAVRKAVSVVKKRYGSHENTIRELILEPGRIRVGPVLREFVGVLTGTPHFTGKAGAGARGPETTEEEASGEQ